MPNILVVPEESRIPREELLLGDKEITITDCDGNQVVVHGLVANDLMVKQVDGTYITFIQALTKAGVGDLAVANATITLSDGSGDITVQEIADGLQGVEYNTPDIQAMYDTEYDKQKGQ